jgi:hypothetical protein
VITLGVVLDGHLREGRALHVRDADGIEGDVDASGCRRHRVGVPIDGLLVQPVDLRRLGPAATGANLPSHFLELGQSASGKEDPRSFAREGKGNRAADRAPASVDHRILVPQQHWILLVSIGVA